MGSCLEICVTPGIPGPTGEPGPPDASAYPSRAAALLAHPVGAPLYIRTGGFAVPGDGGEGLYKKLSVAPADPASPGVIPLVLYAAVPPPPTVYYELVGGVVRARQFGAVPDGVTDNTTAMNNMIAWIKLRGGTACFDGDGIYRTGTILVQGPLSHPIGLYCDPSAWLEKKDTTTHFNLINIFDCEDVSLGDLNIGMRQSENPTIITSDEDGNRIFSNDNYGYGLTIRSSSDVSHSGKLRIHDFHDGVLVYSAVATDPPVYHDVTFDYVELHAVIETDITGHVLSGGWAVAGFIMVNMLHSGARFIDCVGVMWPEPGFAIEFKIDCHDCWFGGFVVKQCLTAVSALGTGTGGTLIDAKNCWFGPGLIDQCKFAVGLSHAERVTFAHIRARHHPDQYPRDPAENGFPWFIQISGASNDCTVMCEIIDYDGGPDDVPPIFVGGDRNTIIIPTINNSVPVYATIAGGASHCSVAVWQDTSLNASPDLGAKFVDENVGVENTNNYYVGGSGFGWRQGPVGGFKVDNNDVSVRQIDGTNQMSGSGYLALTAEHFTARGIQRVVPVSSSSFSIGGHIEQFILEPVGPITGCNIHFPVGSRGKMITITATQTISSVGYYPFGTDTIIGGTSTLAANEPVRFRFLDDTMTWYRA